MDTQGCRVGKDDQTERNEANKKQLTRERMDQWSGQLVATWIGTPAYVLSWQGPGDSSDRAAPCLVNE